MGFSFTDILRLLTAGAFLMVSLGAFEASASAQKSTSEDEGGLKVRPRGVAVGLTPELGIELDMYLTSHWTLGASFSAPMRGYGYPKPHPLDDCQTECKIILRGSVFSEYLSIARFGQIGPRVGLFYSDVREQDEKTVSANIIGPSLGFSAYFTPLRWAGIGVSPVLMPGISFGHEFEEISQREEFIRAEVTFKLFISIKFGDLDGPG